MGGLLSVPVVSTKQQGTSATSLGHQQEMASRWGLCYCCCSVAQSCPTLWDPMDCSMPDFPVLHHLPEFAQVHVYCISDAIQPSHPLMPSSSAPDLSQHQGLFQWVVCSSQMTKILEFQLQHVLPVNIQGLSPLKLTGLISLLSKGRSGLYYSTTVWRQQFEHFVF